MGSTVQKKKKLAFPGSAVIMFLIIIFVTLLTYIVPAGNFGTRVDSATGLEMVDADAFTWAAQTPVTPFRMFVSIAEGFIDGAPIIFLIAFGYFWVFSVVGSGAIGAGINKLLGSKAKDSKLFIPICFVIFSLAGSTYGEFETIYGLIPIFIALACALGYDALVGVGISYLPIAVGFASATTNPFTIGIAQSIAELPMFSGLVFRWIVWVVFTSLGIWWVMRYASKVKANPEKSFVAGLDFSSFDFTKDGEEKQEFTTRHIVLLAGMVCTVACIVVGSLKLGWYINEMSGIFLLAGIVSQLIDRKTPNQIGESLVKAFSEMAVAIIVVGLSRGILAVLRNGNIIDSVVYGLYFPMKNAPSWLVAELMLVAQNIINFFIPSGSGQASAIMPIMVPLADLAGVNRQIAVLAFQFGDGYSNALWPTGVAIMCGISKIPLDRWYKFFLKLFAMMFVLQLIFIGIATAINYGPF